MASPARELSSINFQAMLGGPLVAVINAQAQAAMSTVNFIKAVGFEQGTGTDPSKPDTGKPIYVTFKYPKEVVPYQPGVDGAITGLSIGSAGTQYTDGTYDLTFLGTGSGAAGKAVVSSGVVSNVSLISAGTGYDAATTATLPSSASGTSGSGASITVNFQPKKDPVMATFADMKLEVPILTMLPIPFIRIEETTIDFNAKINSVEESKTDDSLKVDASLSASYKYPPLFSVATVNLKVNTAYQKNTSSGSKVDRTYSMAVHIRAVQDEMPAGMEKILGILEDAIRSQPA